LQKARRAPDAELCGGCGKKDQAVVFELDKDDIRVVLAIFKARIGKEIACRRSSNAFD